MEGVEVLRVVGLAAFVDGSILGSQQEKVVGRLGRYYVCRDEKKIGLLQTPSTPSRLEEVLDKSSI